MCSTNVTSLSSSVFDDEEWSVLVQRASAAAAHEQAVTDRLNQNQIGRSWALGMSVCLRRPVWTSRRRWLDQASAVLGSSKGAKTCRAHRVAASKVLASANAMAAAAESRSGRRVTKTNEHLAGTAGVTESVFRRARRVLRDLELAYEVARGRTLTTAEYRAALAHHGVHQHRAASTWALSSPAYAVRLVEQLRPRMPRRRYAQRNSHEHLSLSPPVREVSPERKNSTTRAVARATRKRDRVLKPLHAQRAAAAIAVRINALQLGRRGICPGRTHIGQLVNLLCALGIDTQRWDGDAIVDRLSADSVQRNRTMPAQLTNPLGWLRVRLQGLDWSGPTPREASLVAASRNREQAAALRAEAKAAWSKASAPDSPIRRHAVANWRNYSRAAVEEVTFGNGPEPVSRQVADARKRDSTQHVRP